jgi:hypothetical protein
MARTDENGSRELGLKGAELLSISKSGEQAIRLNTALYGSYARTCVVGIQIFNRCRSFMTPRVEGNQVQIVICALLTAELFVVDLQISSITADLTSPAVSFLYLSGTPPARVFQLAAHRQSQSL